MLKIHEADIDEKVGYAKEPISFIEFDHCVIDLLHVHLRVTDQLFSLLVSAFNERDTGNSTDLNARPNFKKFLEFLMWECHLTRPYYEAENTIKLRSFNGNERNIIFVKMYENRNMVDLFPDMEDKLDVLNFLFHEYYSILNIIKTFSLRPIDLSSLEERLINWLNFYLVEHPTAKITPYIHCFVFHMSEFLTITPNLSCFNMQGLEKLNDLTTKYYTKNTNRQPMFCIRQLVEKRNRDEFLDDSADNDIFL